MRKHWIVIAIFHLIYLASSVGWASTTTFDPQQKLVMTISGGPAWYRAGKTQTITLQPGIFNTYVANTPNQLLTSGELFIGLQRPIYSHYLTQLGIAVASSTPASLQGDVWQLDDPVFDNFTYQYKIKHTHVAVKGKLLSQVLSSHYLPYLSGSLGVAFNQAYQFSTTPLLFEAVPEPPFPSHQQTAFTYTLGTGLEIAFNEHFHGSIGYELGDWGASSLSASTVQSENKGLTLAHLLTNQLQFSLSYLA